MILCARTTAAFGKLTLGVWPLACLLWALIVALAIVDVVIGGGP